MLIDTDTGEILDLIESDVSAWLESDLDFLVALAKDALRRPHTAAFWGWLANIVDGESHRRLCEPETPSKRYHYLPATGAWSQKEVAYATREVDRIAKMQVSEPCGKFFDETLTVLICELNARLGYYAQCFGELKNKEQAQ